MLSLMPSAASLKLMPCVMLSISISTPCWFFIAVTLAPPLRALPLRAGGAPHQPIDGETNDRSSNTSLRQGSRSDASSDLSTYPRAPEPSAART